MLILEINQYFSLTRKYPLQGYILAKDPPYYPGKMLRANPRAGGDFFITEAYLTTFVSKIFTFVQHLK